MLHLSLLLCLQTAPQEPERLAETLPDGTYVEREVERGPDGEPISHGGYKSWWDDTKAVPLATGRFEHGLRRATWRTYHRNKKRASKGKYEADLRTGEWSYWHDDGSEDAERSGEYSIEERSYENGELFARGERKDGARSGHWTFWWSSGVTMAEGLYSKGQLTGPWIFHHPDGTPDLEWITGEYGGGVRFTGLPDPYLEDLEYPAQPASVHEALLGPVLVLGDEVDAPGILANLLKLDLGDLEQVEIGARLTGVLTEATGGLGFPWHASVQAADVVANRLTVLRWASFWTLLANDPAYASFDFPRAAMRIEQADGRRPLERIHPPFEGRSGSPGLEALGPLAGRFDRERVEFAKGTSDAVDAALDWLTRHQSADGSWSTEQFWKQCAEMPQCDGAGQPSRDLGVTCLALLAFMGDGHTTVAGSYRREVERGIAWILALQDPITGQFGQRRSHGHIYQHGLATLVVAEAALISGSETLLNSAQRGIERIEGARNPYGAWRYEFAPNDENDTSVTGWMIQVLDAGQRAGLDIDRDALVGARAWLDEMSDPGTGRCGYDSIGSASARIERKNDHYPPDKGEAMTGVALFSRYLLGQRPATGPIMSKHADLMVRKLPEWDPAGLGCDMYYWYYGTLAMHQVGGKRDQAWKKALAKAAVVSQLQEGDTAGSWDPVGPWGFAGGRVYSTAIMALTLETPHRFAAFTADER